MHIGWRRIGRSLFILGILFSNLLAYEINAQEAGLLQTKDVATIMDQIFKQHVQTKNMNVELMRHSFGIYIDQFDPDRVYLLQSEVNEFTKMGDDQLNLVIEQYKKGDFTAFKRLNEVIQKAITRARSYRAQLESNPTALFATTLNGLSNRVVTENRPFAKDAVELQQRIRQQIIDFITLEKARYGDLRVTRNAQRTLSMLEDDLREHENSYLYVDEDGNPFTAKEQENLFTLHVLKSLAKSLDAHTSFFNPAEAHDMRIRLEKGFDGIGVTTRRTVQGIFVDKVLPNSPASKNGKIKAGDRIVKINNTKATDYTPDQLEEIFYAKKGEVVSLELKRHAQPESDPETYLATLTSAAIEVDEGRAQSMSEPFQNGLVGVINLTSFYKGENGISSEEDVKTAIQKLKGEGDLRGLILDLRDNSGGFLTQAVKVAGLFITNGIIVISKYSSGDEKFYRDMDGKRLYSGPLIILTSRATASAAEIVAQALQDYGVALIVGDDHTYGKGTIQSQTVTESNATSYFKVTVGKYYTVSGKTPQLQGVKADIVVPSRYSKESRFGEEYLEYTVPSSDAITPSYQDPLADIDPDLKPWYLRYYMPTLQSKRADWQWMLPILRKRSQQRLSEHQEAYQSYLDGRYDVKGEMPDLQLEEAVNILKDMTILQSHKHDQPAKAQVAQELSPAH